jgi:hypothetical protein
MKKIENVSFPFAMAVHNFPVDLSSFTVVFCHHSSALRRVPDLQ